MLSVIVGCGPKSYYAGEELIGACYEGDLPKVEALVRQGVSVNAKFEDGTTPLMAAVANDNTDVVRFLLAHGADIKARNDSGWTALNKAHSDEMKSLLLTFQKRGKN